MDEDKQRGQYSLAAGVAVATKLAAQGRLIFTTDEARRVAADLGIPPSGVAMMLSRLAGTGWIVRLRRGLYVGTGRVPGGTDVHPYAIATALVQPSAISMWSALSYHGLTTQVPRIVTATTPKKVTTPSMRARYEGAHTKALGARHTWSVGHVEIEYVTVRLDRFFGFEEVWIDQQFRVPVMDRERTIIDLVALPRIFGGLDAALATLEEHWRALDMPRLVDHAIRYDSKAVAGRLGWCLEEVGAGSDILERLLSRVGPGQQILDTNATKARPQQLALVGPRQRERGTLMAAPLERRIRAECERTGVLREVVEKDYAMGYVLAALYSQADVASWLVFKGGTALRKAHFPDYRFSEDLDFTALSGAGLLERAIQAAASTAENMLRAQGDFDVSVTRYPVRDPHPEGQDAFRIHVRFPWQGRSSCSLKIEITIDEPLLSAPVALPLLHGYDEPLTCSLRCYALEEVVAEKLRSLLQTRARLAARGWARPRSRDYYDLWQLLCARPGLVDIAAVAQMLPAKCAVRAVSFEGVDDFFDSGVVERAGVDWGSDLRRMVPDRPEFELCIDEVRGRVGALLAGR